MNIFQSIGVSLVKAQDYFISLDWYWQLMLLFIFVMFIGSIIAQAYRRQQNG